MKGLYHNTLIQMRADHIADLGFGLKSIADECARLARAGDLILRKWIACDIELDEYCARKEAIEVELDALEIVVRGLRAIAEGASAKAEFSALVSDL